jgi:hypothetical protein
MTNPFDHRESAKGAKNTDYVRFRISLRALPNFAFTFALFAPSR